ncbi:outer membrane protein [Methylosinus sp. Sm6]|uniref:outer membrane protein n=1 Tax=Methylosinus sp. Sm6 TaxID=2866948 RepID=UPI001C99B0FD|nr:outer membrane beta-barrel protein [Methylosinus sp. Sm6]MBY6240897.1 outer membrane beta-barrel protein [Methylosinus sp. Sm6]
MKTWTIACCSALLSVGTATAADLPARKAEPAFAPPPALLFEGFYVGAHAGYAGFGDRAQTVLAANNAVLSSKTGSGGSFIGGVHAGYDWRYGPLVYGVVGDISGARARAYTVDPIFGYGVQNTIDAQGSIRGRLGWNYERALLYVTGGMELAHIERSYQAPLGSTTTNWWSVTPTVGAGVEYALDTRWSAHIETRWFGGRTRAEAENLARPALATRHAQGEGSLTAGVSYHFGD